MFLFEGEYFGILFWKGGLWVVWSSSYLGASYTYNNTIKKGEIRHILKNFFISEFFDLMLVLKHDKCGL